MALERRLIDIPFAAGLGQKDDPKQLAPPKLLTLENGEFTTLKQLRKRPQLRSLATLSSARGILAHEYRDELVALDGEKLYSLTGATWNSKGDLLVVNAPTQPVARTPAIAVDSTYSGDWRMTVWKPAAGQALQYAVEHIPTKQVLYSGTVSGAVTGAMAPKVLALGSYFVILYYTDATGTATLYYQKVTIPTVSVAPVWSAAVSVGALYSAHCFYDACVQSSRLWVVWHTTSAGADHNLNLVNYDTDFNAITLDPAGIGDNAGVTLKSLAIFPDILRAGEASPGVIVAWGRSDGLYAQPIFYNDESQLYRLIAGEDTNAAAQNAEFLTGYSVSAAFDTCVLFYGVTSAGTYPSSNYYALRSTKFSVWDYTDPPANTRASLAQGLRPCAKLFTQTGISTTQVILPLIHHSASQPTIFAARVDTISTWPMALLSLDYIARYLPGNAGGFTTNSITNAPWTPPYTVLAESTGGNWAHVRRTDSDSTGVDLMTLAYATTASAEEYADNLLVAAGGLAWLYDGSSVVEHGFLMSPQVESSPFSGGAGSGSHTYRYQFVYAWPDARGQVQRSAPAPEVTSTAARAGYLQRLTADPIDGTHQITMNLPCLAETAKTGVIIEVYRTTDNGSVYYFVGSASNSSTASTVSFTDGMPDDSDGAATSFLLEQRQLYTEGGVLQNDPAPSSTIICEHNGRLFVADSQAPGVVAHTRKLIPAQAGAAGIPAEFSSYFQVRVDSTGEVITGIGSLDEKLIVFMRNRIAFIVGEGPDDTGAGGSFAVYPLPHKVGAIRHGSVVSTANGLLFQSDQGILLLDRAMNIEQIGLDIETYAQAATIISGVALTTSTQVQLVDSTNNRVLALDTLVGQWSMWPLSAAPASICRYGTNVVLLMASGLALQETAWPGVYGDNNSWVGLKAGTAWVKPGLIAGYERLRRIYITGEYKGPHVLHWALYQDYDLTTATQSGSSVVQAASGRGDYQIRIDVVHQKCEAFALLVWDAATIPAGQEYVVDKDGGGTAEITAYGTSADGLQHTYEIRVGTLVAPPNTITQLRLWIDNSQVGTIASKTNTNVFETATYNLGDVDSDLDGMMMHIEGGSVAATWSWTAPDLTPDEGLRLSGLTLELGVKKGGAKLPLPQITG